ncbi:hypothetical protein [Streptomyces sp. KL110A]|uniref:hypothetical protein n=1 Tax=Streptomyces sp. KL110A TaxID=3384221 RepID=UPI0038C2D503
MYRIVLLPRCTVETGLDIDGEPLTCGLTGISGLFRRTWHVQASTLLSTCTFSLMYGRHGLLITISLGVFVFGGVACHSGAEEADPVRTQESQASTPTESVPAERTWSSAPPLPTASALAEETRPATPSLKPDNERADLKSFEIDDQRAFGTDRIWIAWTIMNSASEEVNYTWDWEALDTQGVRVAKGTETAIGVLPGETTYGGIPTTLETAEVKLRITKFDRTAAP